LRRRNDKTEAKKAELKEVLAKLAAINHDYLLKQLQKVETKIECPIMQMETVVNFEMDTGKKEMTESISDVFPEIECAIMRMGCELQD